MIPLIRNQKPEKPEKKKARKSIPNAIYHVAKHEDEKKD
jgi:hypothetical protein